jgi:hypothetical protein
VRNCLERAAEARRRGRGKHLPGQHDLQRLCLLRGDFFSWVRRARPMKEQPRI